MAFPKFSAAIVQVTTKDGIVGIGECRSRFHPEIRGMIVEKIFKPILIGKDPFDVERHWRDMYRAMRLWGHSRGYFVEALSGVEMALWDVMGKALKMPIYKLIGGLCHESIPVYASTVHHDWFKDAKGLSDHSIEIVEQGITGIKLSVGFGLKTDVENVKIIRDAVGDDVQIMVDATSAYDVHTAIKVGRALERHDVLFFEEPIPPENIDGYIEVSKALDMAVAAGECEYTRYTFKDLINKRAVDIVQPDVGKVGGILECKKIAAMADAYDMPVAYHTGTGAIGVTAATLHLAASTPHFLMFEYMYRRVNPLTEELPKEQLTNHKDGELKVPNKPGLGVELNEDVISKYLVK